jgi:outer membrane protein assembly factor BamB
MSSRRDEEERQKLNLNGKQHGAAGRLSRPAADEAGRSGRRWLLLLIAALGVLLAGCSGEHFASTSWPGITVDDPLVYVAFNQQIYAIDPSQQRAAGEYPASPGSTTYYAAPVVTEELLIAGGYDNVLYGIDRATLNVRWNFHLAGDRYIASPVLFDGTVYAATAAHVLYALDLDALNQLGAVEKPDEVRRSAERTAIRWTFEADQGLWATPLVTAEAIYITSLDHHIYALETETGRELWATKLSGAMAATPVLAPDQRTLFVGNFDYDLYALDASSGDIRWTVDAENWVWGRPALAGDKLFFGDLAGYLYAVDLSSGQVLWRAKVADAIRAAPIYDAERDLIYVAGRKVANPGNISTRGIVLALDASDYRTVWEQPTDEAVYTSPALNDGLLLVAPAQGETLLLVYNAETGVLQWRFAPAVKK